MAAQTLEQVIASLNSVYQPQLDAVESQRAALPGQFQAQEAGLNAQKDKAFGDILSGARSRGTGVAFGGIPLGEQAQYSATQYAPALANLKSTQNQQQSSLVDAINRINEAKFTTGNQLYQFGVQQDMAERQFQFQQAEAARQAAESARSAAAANSFVPTLGAGTNSVKNDDPYGGVNKQNAANNIVSLLNTNDPGVIAKTIKAITSSANNGNAYDRFKLDLLRQYKTSSQYGKLLAQAISGPSVARGLL